VCDVQIQINRAAEAAGGAGDLGEERTAAGKMIATNPAIAVSNLEMAYPTQDGSAVRALGPIDLAISAQEFVSVVGPSGCGKSTLLKILAGLIRPAAGVAAIHGEEIRGPRMDIGVVFQSPVLLPWKTVLDNVLLPIKVRRKPLGSFKDRAMDLLSLVGLDGFAMRYPHELSGGMQQRAGIVRALIGDPGILLMDEPFGALDAITRDQLNVDLLDIWAKTKKTVLFITHGISEAVFLSDRVIVMGARPGQVIEQCVVGLPRPRHVAQIALPAFGELVAQIRLALERGAPVPVSQPRMTVIR
jgi:NitT/TauT family transport system ATP-binding protein